MTFIAHPLKTLGILINIQHPLPIPLNSQAKQQPSHWIADRTQGCSLAILRDSESQLINIHKQTEPLQVLALCWVFTATNIKVMVIGLELGLGLGLRLVTLGLRILGLRQPRVRAKFRRRVLRWQGGLSAKVNRNANMGYSHDHSFRVGVSFRAILLCLI